MNYPKPEILKIIINKPAIYLSVPNYPIKIKIPQAKQHTNWCDNPKFNFGHLNSDISRKMSFYHDGIMVWLNGNTFSANKPVIIICMDHYLIAGANVTLVHNI